ncbi:MAG: hypothetical protein ACREQA_04510 [Candidatus Binatia bacterium]
MVSNSLNMDLDELLEAIRRLSREYSDSPEYKKWRKDLPDDWPI